MVSVLGKMLRIGEGHQLKKLSNLAQAVNNLGDETKALSDEELRAKTAEFKERLSKKESLDSLLPEAFAVCREAADRVLGLRPFDVQLMGAAALHFGNIAEMKTGEGKTLVASLASYLNGLTGEGVHVVTVNDYLASYQSELIGRVHKFLGLSVGCILTEQTPEVRAKQYQADITYGTNNEFGFDYLRDNMTWNKGDLVQRGHNFAIVDEVDSILIDEARTPLIISGPSEGDVTRWYSQFAKLVPSLKRDEDYEVDEKKKVVGILEPGIEKVEDYLGIDNLYEPSNTALISYLNNAIKAKELFIRDKDYVVRGGEVLIIDEHTGRILPGRRYNEGLHQALEAKEHVRVQAENQTFATITLQNYFRMYKKLSGMTGTAETEAAEFMNTYKLGVIPIPTNKPVIRKDQNDLIFRTKKEKLAAIVRDVAEHYSKGQPVLLGTASVESSEVLSSLLDVAQIPHTVLNAKQHEKEAAVVAVAGRKGMVTVATNMAGRGTDIMLGGNVEFLTDKALKDQGYSAEDTPEEYEKLWGPTLEKVKEEVKKEHDEVVALGGLYVLGTERHESRRIDDQLRGRSGRQGDPGESRFYLSLEDDLMRLFNTQLVARVMARGMTEGEPITAKQVSRGVFNAQRAVESRNYEIRKNVLEYDDVMNKQREIVYSERGSLVSDDAGDSIRTFAEEVVKSYVTSAFQGRQKAETWNLDSLWEALSNLYPISLDEEEVKEEISKLSPSAALKKLSDEVSSDILSQFDAKREAIGEAAANDLEKKIVLTVIDKKWREHLYEMDYLKDGIGLRGIGQRDPLVEYQREGYQMYSSMVEAIKEECVHLFFAIKAAQIREVVDEEADEDRREEEEAREESREEEREEVSQEEKKEVSGALEADLAPITHEDKKLPLEVRVKNSSSASSPWSDGRTFPGTPKNAPCPCGSGRKYKMCHGQNEVKEESTQKE
ncbi:MAG: preprotein translocase subunit SecA [Aeriscardovia sp.]|nr:preprotein translocase subunit SecA [Aeriscardovia sp.]